MHQDAHEFLNLLLNTVLENLEAHDRKVVAQKKVEAPSPAEEEAIDMARSESTTVQFPSILPVPDIKSFPYKVVAPAFRRHTNIRDSMFDVRKCLTA